MNYTIFYILLGLFCLIIGIYILKKSREDFDNVLVNRMVSKSRTRGNSTKIPNPYAMYTGQ
jgi:hypothetical protein